VRKIKILHLEDLPFDVEMVERVLRKSSINFEKVVVDNKADFEQALEEFIPDIILSDHSLPSFNSEAALKMVKQKSPNTPFILVTATVPEAYAINVVGQGAIDYLIKTNLLRLPAAIFAALERSRFIEEKVYAENELKHSYKQIQNLALHLQDVREEERSTIAREVHDELGQQLTALKLDTSWLLLKLNTIDSDVKHKLMEMERLVNGTLKTVKKIVTELHPAILNKLGIKNAIIQQSIEFESRTGTKVDLDICSDAMHIDKKTATALFRIYQESLTNIAKYAKAKKVKCVFIQKNADIFLTVEDDGIGFNKKLIEKKQSLGLLGMQERVYALGGKLKVNSKPGKGTVISVVVPG
jgi:signal transduction histidine kinase